jgi:hypothetical protein
MPAGQTGSSTNTDFTLTVLGSFAIWWVASYFASFVIAGEVSEVCLGGIASFSKAMYKTSVRGIGRLLGTDIIVGLVALGVFITIDILFVLAALITKGNANWVLLMIGIVLGSIGAILVIWLCLFTVQIAAIERHYWFSALRRSASFVLRSKKQSLAILVLWLFIILVYSTLNLLLQYLSVPKFTEFTGDAHANTTLLANMITFMVDSVLTVLLQPISSIFLTLAYYYLRRKAGELSVGELEDIRAYEMS